MQDAKSHRCRTTNKLNMAPEWMEDCHAQSNNKVDAPAGTVADLHRIPLAAARTITDRTDKLNLIQNRLMAVPKLLPQTEHTNTLKKHIEYKSTHTKNHHRTYEVETYMYY